MLDKYTAVWVSHSSISDFLKCPRAYYLKNIYKDPKTGHKVNHVSPALALGQAVHDVLEGLSSIKVEDRLKISLLDSYESAWRKVSGKLGGFKDADEEFQVKARGTEMLKRVTDHPGPILNKAIKIQQDLPYYYISEADNIILCGKVDWLEYIESNDSVHVIDFKTGLREEKEDSLQLPIYQLLIKNCQKRNLSGASYWYLATSDVPISMTLPKIEESEERVLTIARQIKIAREAKEFNCPRQGCYACRPFEVIISGGAEFVGVGGYKQDLYII